MTLERMLRTEPIFWQSLALLALVAGIILIVTGVRMSKRSTPTTWQEAQWLRQIRRMARGEDSHVYGADELQAVWRQWLRQLGTAVTGAGVGVFVGTLVSFALAQLALHAPFSLPEQLFWFCFMPPMGGMSLGFTCGSLVGARQRATVQRHGATLANPSISHKVSDYRSPLLPLIAAIPAMVYTTLTILVAPYYIPFDPFDVREYFEIHGHALIAPPQWILAIYPGAMWLTVLLVELCVWVRVKAAARITSPDAALARGASMALTGLNLSFIYALLIATPAQIGSLDVMTLLSRTTHDLNLDSLVLALYLSMYLIGFLGMVVALTAEGRLGGRITGWLWSKERTQTVASAEG